MCTYRSLDNYPDKNPYNHLCSLYNSLYDMMYRKCPDKCLYIIQNKYQKHKSY